MDRSPLLRRAELVPTGLRPERDPELHRPRRGVYQAAGSAVAGPAARYRLAVEASHLTLTGDHIYSHESAAVLLGLPVLSPWPTAVHLIDERRTGGRSQLDVVRHCLGLEHVAPVLVDGMLTTSPARTAFDIALVRPFEHAVVVADGALRDHPSAADELSALVEGHGRRRGWQKAVRVLRFADPRSGSAGESLSRCRIESHGFPTPDLQVEVVTDGVRDVADFGWPELGALGEFDGEVKYRLDRYRRGGTPEDVVIREKNRENRLRRGYPQFARWDWRDLTSGRLERILLDAGIPKRSRA